MDDYVDMLCDLTLIDRSSVPVPAEVIVGHLSDAAAESIYDCYLDAFEHGDAGFFRHQSDAERRDFFDTLGRDGALEQDSSIIMYVDGELIGFSYVLQYGESNAHISCMCVRPAHQGKGYGRFMLDLVQQRAADAGFRTITLGTETGMRAHTLYAANGFAEVID